MITLGSQFAIATWNQGAKVPKTVNTDIPSRQVLVELHKARGQEDKQKESKKAE